MFSWLQVDETKRRLQDLEAFTARETEIMELCTRLQDAQNSSSNSQRKLLELEQNLEGSIDKFHKAERMRALELEQKVQREQDHGLTVTSALIKHVIEILNFSQSKQVMKEKDRLTKLMSVCESTELKRAKERQSAAEQEATLVSESVGCVEEELSFLEEEMAKEEERMKEAEDRLRKSRNAFRTAQER